MRLEEILAQVDDASVIVVTDDELAVVKAEGELVRAVETSIGGPMEVIALSGRVLFHERMGDGRLLLRRMFDRASADALIAARREDYDAMWEGCGVHIDYNLR